MSRCELTANAEGLVNTCQGQRETLALTADAVDASVDAVICL